MTGSCIGRFRTQCELGARSAALCTWQSDFVTSFACKNLCKSLHREIARQADSGTGRPYGQGAAARGQPARLRLRQLVARAPGLGVVLARTRDLVRADVQRVVAGGQVAVRDSARAAAPPRGRSRSPAGSGGGTRSRTAGRSGSAARPDTTIRSRPRFSSGSGIGIAASRADGVRVDRLACRAPRPARAPSACRGT